jgi:hypothetical protein
VLDKLAPSHSIWDSLASPMATILAAIIALVAAGIAFRSVRNQISADDKRVLNGQRIEAASEALAALQLFLDSAHGARGARAAGSVKILDFRQEERTYVDAGNRLLVARNRLLILGGFARSAAWIKSAMSDIVNYAKNNSAHPEPLPGRDMDDIAEVVQADLGIEEKVRANESDRPRPLKWGRGRTVGRARR